MNIIIGDRIQTKCVLYSNTSPERSLQIRHCREVIEVLTVLMGEIYPFILLGGWTGAMRVKFLAQGNNSNSN